MRGGDPRPDNELVLLPNLIFAAALMEGEAEVDLLAARAEALAVEQVNAGQRGELSLVLLEAPERDWPLAVRIDEGALALVDDRLDWGAVVDPLALQPRLRVPFVAPEQAGHYEVRATLSYAVCNEQWCWIKRGELRWTVEVL